MVLMRRTSTITQRTLARKVHIKTQSTANRMAAKAQTSLRPATPEFAPCGEIREELLGKERAYNSENGNFETVVSGDDPVLFGKCAQDDFARGEVGASISLVSLCRDGVYLSWWVGGDGCEEVGVVEYGACESDWFVETDCAD